MQKQIKCKKERNENEKNVSSASISCYQIRLFFFFFVFYNFATSHRERKFLNFNCRRENYRKQFFRLQKDRHNLRTSQQFCSPTTTTTTTWTNLFSNWVLNGMICFYFAAASLWRFARQQKTQRKMQAASQMSSMWFYFAFSAFKSLSLSRVVRKRTMNIKSSCSFNIHHHVQCTIVLRNEMKFIKLS